MREEPYHHVVVRHIGPDGRRCRSSDPGSVKLREETQTYYGELPSLEGGKPDRVSLDTADLGSAWQTLREMRRQRARELEGLADPLLASARTPLADHLEEWLDEVAAGGTSAHRVAVLRSRVTHLAELAEWKRLADLSNPSAAKALQELREKRRRGMPRGYKGVSAATRNHYLAAARQFAHWCLDEDRLMKDPFRRLENLQVETDPRHARRSPSDQEVKLLLGYLATPGCPSRCGMTGAQRALGYRVAMATGFRAGEIRSLRRQSFDLDGATVVIPATVSKRRKRDRQHIPSWLVNELREWFLVAANGLWEGFPAAFPGRLLSLDQVGAGVERVIKGPDGTPLHFDFHSLRHWYCTWATHLPGISPKALLEMARHSDPRLTLQRYSHGIESEVRQAVEKLPRPG